MNTKVSVIIPSRTPDYLKQTVDDLLKTAAGDIEIIVPLDRHKLTFNLSDDKRVRVLSNDTIHGERSAINHAAVVAKGKYLMKLDEHCTIGEGWDEILKADCADNWVVVPARYWFDAPNWTVMDTERVEMMSYIWPFKRPYAPRLTTRPWYERAHARKDIPIDEDMGFQGSCFFLTKKFYMECLCGLSEAGYGTQSSDAEEIGLKTWLGPWGGAVMRNKKTWYAHWAKPNSFWRGDPDVVGRVPDKERLDAWAYTFHYWWRNQWQERAHDLDWLFDKFGPLPGWPEDWEWLSAQYLKSEHMPPWYANLKEVSK